MVVTMQKAPSFMNLCTHSDFGMNNHEEIEINTSQSTFITSEKVRSNNCSLLLIY